MLVPWFVCASVRVPFVLGCHVRVPCARACAVCARAVCRVRACRVRVPPAHLGDVDDYAHLVLRDAQCVREQPVQGRGVGRVWGGREAGKRCGRGREAVHEWLQVRSVGAGRGRGACGCGAWARDVGAGRGRGDRP